MADGRFARRAARVGADALSAPSRSERSKLAAHYFRAVHSPGGVPGINHELRLLHDAFEVVIGMIRDDHHTVVLSEIFQFSALHLQVVFSSPPDKGEVGIVVTDLRSLFLQQLDNRQRWRFPQVVNILLYATPSTSTRAPFTDFLCEFSAPVTDAST